MKPIIAIIAGVDDEIVSQAQPLYISAIERAGGIPIVMPYVWQRETADQIVSLCDGFLFAGGPDVHPKRYGEEIKEACGVIRERRDELELMAFEEIYKTKKPILAICRGSQVVNVALGGTLYQDIPTEIKTDISHRQTEPKSSHSHDVNVTEGTPLHALVGKSRMGANSFHHQCIKALGKGLEVMATADDGIIEAIYSTEQYIMAYQWHPERLVDISEDNKAIFDDFIEACSK